LQTDDLSPVVGGTLNPLRRRGNAAVTGAGISHLDQR